jgi:hypothetical protein
VYSLTRHIAEDSRYDAHARLLAKFVEEDCVSGGFRRDFVGSASARHFSLPF